LAVLELTNINLEIIKLSFLEIFSIIRSHKYFSQILIINLINHI
jgi:hypothetical protein